MNIKLAISLFVILSALAALGWTRRADIARMIQETVPEEKKAASSSKAKKKYGINPLGSERPAIELDGMEMNIYVPSRKPDEPEMPSPLPNQENRHQNKLPSRPDSLSMVSSKEFQKDRADEQKANEAAPLKKSERPRLKPVPKIVDLSNMSSQGQRIQLGNGGGGIGSSMGRTISAHNPGQGESRSILKNQPNGDLGPVVMRCKEGCPLPPGAIPLTGPIPKNAKVIDYDCNK
ncbi:MAG: hypothetical protein K5838_03890 [Elusimicrobiales bacterium]|nr:hypothetical protein [Elusimicrobiales bacterium]